MTDDRTTKRYCPICGKAVTEPAHERFGEWAGSEAHAEEYVGGLPTGTVKGFAVSASGPRHPAAVAVNPRNPREVYAAMADGRLFRSGDGGLRWEAAVKAYARDGDAR